MSNLIRFNDKQSFIDALEARRPFWREQDAKAAATHKAEEKAWLEQARAKLREALKMDYDALKAKLKQGYGDLTLGQAPKCPVLMEPKIDRVLAALTFTQGKVFTVDSKGTWDLAHDLLTADPDAPKTVC